MEPLHEQVQETEEYNRFLETVLIQLCEELDLDPDELVEDAMTMAREREHIKKMEKQGKKTERAHGRHGAGEKTSAFHREYSKSQALGKRYEKEMKSRNVYGRGGKRIKAARHSDTVGVDRVGSSPSHSLGMDSTVSTRNTRYTGWSVPNPTWFKKNKQARETAKKSAAKSTTN